MNKLKLLLSNKNTEYVMLVLILGYVLFKIANRSLGDIFFTLLLLGTVLSLIVNWHFIIKDKIVWLLGASLLVQVLSWFHGIYYTTYTPSYFTFSPLVNLFFFLPLAYWLKGNILHIFSVLSAYCLGVILACIFHSKQPIQEFLLGLGGERVDFGITNANHTATLAGGAVLAAGFMLYMVLKKSVDVKSRYKYSFLCFLILMFIINLLLVYMTFSRATWLALAAVLIATIATFIFRSDSIKKFIIKFSIAILGTILIAFTLLQVPHINSRVFDEKEVIQELADHAPEQIENTSVGVRVKLWYSAIPWIKQYPLLGLGDKNASIFVIQSSPYLNSELRQEVKHLHNGHITILVSYGILGLFIVWGIFGYILKSTFLLKTKQKYVIIYATSMFTLYYFIINMFESFFVFKTGELLQAVMLGCIYSFYLKQKLDNEENPN